MDHKEIQVNKEKLDPKEHQELPVFRDHQAQLDQKESQERMEPLDQKEVQERKVHQDNKVIKDQMDFKDLLAHRETKVSPVNKEIQEK